MEQSIDSTVDEAVAVFRTFGDATRLRLVNLLSRQRGPDAHCVGALASRLGVSQPAVSQHLRVLRGFGLVSGERRGYRVHYFINAEALERCRQLARDALSVGEEGDGEACPEGRACHGAR